VVPAVRPVIWIGLEVPLTGTQLPPLSWYAYDEIALPPLKPGVNSTESAPLETANELIVGAPGTASGIPDAGVDTVPTPTALSARTWTVYEVPLTRPGITIDVDADATATHEPPLTW
jgi:hypothetical protein